MLKSFLLATRPKTLVAAITPPIAAHGLYFYHTEKNQFYYLALCLIGAILIQIATNFYNDAIDDIKGADANRVGPKRMSSSGELSAKSLFIAAHFINLLVLIIGYFIYLRGGWPFIIIGVTSIYLSYGYTGGPFPLAYLGLGELFVLLYFGFVSVLGSYYLFALDIHPQALVLGMQLGLLSTTLIMVNNFRDRETDPLVGKNTLATKLNKNKYLNLLYICLVSPHFLQLFFANNLKSFFTILSMPIMLKVHRILQEHKDPKELNDALKFCAIHLLLFSLMTTLGFCL